MATIKELEQYVRKYAKEYGYAFPEMIVAQACHECGIANGELKSGLAKKANNFWGMKCGSSWKGKSVNMKTQEYYNGSSSPTTIRDNFRAYDSVEEGVKGYFQFIQKTRYANLKTASSPEDYIRKIAADGWATGPNYANACIKMYNQLYKNNAGTPAKDKTPVKNAIKSLQQELNNFGGYGLAVDGIFGKKTLAAVEKYNKS